MDTLRLDQHLCFSLYSATRAVSQAYGPLLGRLGLTYPQYLVLLALREAGPSSVSTLGDTLHLDSGTLTPLLKRLEGKSLVSRRRDPADERRLLVHLTVAGRRVQERACAVPPELFREVGLTAAQARKLKDQIDSLVHALSARTERKAS